MRREFFRVLYDLMKENPDIIALTGDLGYIGFDRIRDDMPERFYNVGAAEIAMLDIAVGMALSGKIPICYSITPFLLYRPFEVIRNYIDHEQIPVILIGSGREKDYEHDGFSHFAGDDWKFMTLFKGIECMWPYDKEAMTGMLKRAIRKGKPAYINLKKP
jgi:transketolase